MRTQWERDAKARFRISLPSFEKIDSQIPELKKKLTWIPWKLKIEKTGDGDIGDSAIVSLKVNSAAINYHDVFT